MSDWREFVRKRLSLPELPRQRERQIVDDVARLLEQVYRDALAGGASDEEAQAQTSRHIPDWESFISDVYRSERGNRRSRLEKWQAESYEKSNRSDNMITQWMNDLRHDLLYGLRVLRKSPGFTLVALLTLATGIGASTAIFSVVKAVQFDPLPYPEADKLVNIYLSDPSGGMNQLFLSFPEYEDYRDRTQTLENAAAYASFVTVTLTGEGAPQRLPTNFVTPSFFDILGIEPALGRRFGPEDNRTPNGHPVAILSHGLWLRSFGGDPGILGQAINLSGTPYTVVGVLPPDYFDITGRATPTEVWLPIMQLPAYWRPDDALTLRRGRVFGVLGRRKPGVTLEQTAADIENIGQQLQKDYPENNEGIFAHTGSLRDLFFTPVQTPTFALLIGAGLLLLTGCANVTGLMLIRAAERRRESALRLALGASRGRLLRQLGAESLLLVLVAGALGIILGTWLLRLLAAFSPVQLPGFVNLQIDATVLLAALVLSLLVGLATAAGLGAEQRPRRAAGSPEPERTLPWRPPDFRLGAPGVDCGGNRHGGGAANRSGADGADVFGV